MNGRVRLKYSLQAAQVQVRREINDPMEKETDTLFCLSSMAPLCPFDPFALMAPIRFPYLFRTFPSTLLCSGLRLPETALSTPGYLFYFGNRVGCASDAEKQSHRRLPASSQWCNLELIRYSSLTFPLSKDMMGKVA